MQWLVVMLIAVLFGGVPTFSTACSASKMDCCASATPCADCSCTIAPDTKSEATTSSKYAVPAAPELLRIAPVVMTFDFAHDETEFRRSALPDQAASHAPPLFLFTHAFLI